MRHEKILFLLMMAGGLMTGCSKSDNPVESQAFLMRNYANTGCKGFVRETRTQNMHEYVECRFLSDGFLSLTHYNARFNCAPGELSMQASIDGHEIKIIENEEFAKTRCLCPYDMSCELGPLTDGTYTVTIYRKTEQERLFRFSIDCKRGAGETLVFEK